MISPPLTTAQQKQTFANATVARVAPNVGGVGGVLRARRRAEMARERVGRVPKVAERPRVARRLVSALLLARLGAEGYSTGRRTRESMLRKSILAHELGLLPTSYPHLCSNMSSGEV